MVSVKLCDFKLCGVKLCDFKLCDVICGSTCVNHEFYATFCGGSIYAVFLLRLKRHDPTLPEHIVALSLIFQGRPLLLPPYFV